MAGVPRIDHHALLVTRLGADGYGLFALVTIVAAYFSNLEMGFGTANVRFLAQARGAHDLDAERNVLATTLSVFLLATVVGGTGAILAAPSIAATFANGPPEVEGQAVGALRIGAVLLALSFLGSYAGTSLQALGHFGDVIRARLVFGTLSSVSAATIVLLDGDVKAVLLGQLAVLAAQLITLLICLAGRANVPLRPAFHAATARRMARYGISVLAAALAYQLLLQGPPSVLAAKGVTAQIAAYAVPALVFQQLVTLASSASIAFMPFASAARVDAERRFGGVRSNLRLTLLLLGPIAGVLATTSHTILESWIDPSFAEAADLPLALLGCASLALALSGPPADIVRGMGNPAWLIVFTGAASAIALSGAALLVDTHGQPEPRSVYYSALV